MGDRYCNVRVVVVVDPGGRATLLQNKLWAFLLGAGTAGAAYISTRKQILSTASEVANAWGIAPPPAHEQAQKPAPIFGPDIRARVVRLWNQSVDSVFEPLISELSKRNL
ncbi:hypothetical protein WJX81_002277 [Elliptochloris bilobata]|uniref:MICOS complex subunit MIC13 n=1 Tax=Elliptochloris bilobata TaxID=381761 RepID=A0AAW1QKZ2_9CHLO